MAVTLHHDDKFHRAYIINQVGDIHDPASPRTGGVGSFLSTENHVRVITENLTAGTSIAVKARLKNQPTSSFVTIYTITGSENKILDLNAWDIIHFEVLTYDAAPGKLYVSGFVKNMPGVDINGTISTPVSIQEEPLTQQHINSNVVTAGIPINVTAASGNIRSIIIQNPFDGPNQNSNNKVLLISWDSGTTYFSVPNGAFYVAENINEPVVTIDSTSNDTNFEIVLEHN